jgi:hypothetical protein
MVGSFHPLVKAFDFFLCNILISLLIIMFLFPEQFLLLPPERDFCFVLTFYFCLSGTHPIPSLRQLAERGAIIDLKGIAFSQYFYLIMFNNSTSNTTAE